MSDRVIGLALSGGGSRAAAFHLGCLRALHDRDLLHRVRVISGISGGSLLAALWAYGPADFDVFDDTAVALLRHGLRAQIIRRTLQPTAIARNLTASTQAALSTVLGHRRPTAARRSNRTDGLAAALSDLAFGHKTMPDVTHHGLDVVLTATDLRTSNAVRFGSTVSSCSPLGTIVEPIPVATAVAASAAFPLLLPALERTFTFQRGNSRHTETLLLTDGGIYDNLGLSVLEPDRSPAHTPHVYHTPYIISCDAGRGELRTRTPHFMPTRAARTLDVIHRRAQNAGRARLHEWAATGRLHGFTMAYLGMRDNRLPTPLTDLVPRTHIATYPTNLSPMNDTDLHHLTTRGEQLTRTLLPHYCPQLI